MTSAWWMIQLYNVSATNRLNLPGNSTPQKTITVVEASLKVVIMLPFWVSSFSITIETRKVGNTLFSCVVGVREGNGISRNSLSWDPFIEGH